MITVILLKEWKNTTYSSNIPRRTHNDPVTVADCERENSAAEEQE